MDNKRRRTIIAGLMIATTLLLACGLFVIQRTSHYAESGKSQYDLVIYCPHPADFISSLVEEFETETGIRVQVISHSSGELLSRLTQEKEAPVCDVLWGGSFLTVQSHAELFEDYISINEADVQPEFKNTQGYLTRFTDIPSVIMVNTDLIGDIVIEGYADLLNPALKGRIACANPANSSSAFEHLTNMLYAMGDGDPENGWGYVEKLIANMNGRLLDGSSAVYKGVAAGDYVVGLTFEEGAANYVADGAHVQIVYMKEGVVSTPDGICVIRNTRHREAAHRFIDFATGFTAQQMIVTHLNRRSVRVDIPAPDYLPDKAQIPMIYVDPEEVERDKNEWIEHFAKMIAAIGQEGQ